jgi:hypothetical protein
MENEMTTIHIRFTASTKERVEELAEDFLKEFPPSKHGTFFHAPQFIGYCEDGYEQWEIIGERWKHK